MNKDTIKLLITEYQEKVVNVSLQKRMCILEENLNYVFVGLRRAGKSYLMYQQIQTLLKRGHKKEEILYFNFEDDRLSTFLTADLDMVKICYEELFECKPIFFLDEIQIIDQWEKFARRLADQGYRVYITGSNAKMLSSQIATTLGGRYQIQHVYPYSFYETLIAAGVDCQDKNYQYRYNTQILKLYETYFRFGGLPELIQVADKRSWLSNLYQKIFFGDLVTRYQIRNDFALRVLIKKLAESVKQPTSFNRLANIVSAAGKKISTDTVIDYLAYLEESCLVFSLENIAAKLAEKNSIKKYYFIDNGILNLFLIDPPTFLLENQVASHLYRQHGPDLYYYHKNIELDFYVYQKHLAVQVCYSLKEPETRKRETDALLKAAAQLNIEQMYIITKDEEESFVLNGHTIQVLPIHKFLLN